MPPIPTQLRVQQEDGVALRPNPFKPGGRFRHEVLQASNDPPDDEPCVGNTYSENMAARQFEIETAGLTDVFSITFFRDSFLSPEFSR